MGALLGYLLGRRRERPEVHWAHELDRHADELRVIIARLQHENEMLWEVVAAAEAALPWLDAAGEGAADVTTRLQTSLQRVDAKSAE